MPRKPPSVMMPRKSPSETRRKLPSEMRRKLPLETRRKLPSLLTEMRRKPHSWNLKTTNSTSSTSIMLKCSTKVTGLPIKNHDHTIMTALLPNQITGKVPNNASNHGNAEVPGCAKEADGAQDSMDVKDLHSQPKLQDYRTLIEK